MVPQSVPHRGGKETLSNPIARITTLLRRACAMAAIAALPLAVAAAPASAKLRQKVQEVKTCSSKPATRSTNRRECEVTNTSPADGSKDTYACKEGKLVKAASLN